MTLSNCWFAGIILWIVCGYIVRISNRPEDQIEKADAALAGGFSTASYSD
jgi:hypothetical protein